MIAHPLSDVDPRLLTEAFRRARANNANVGVDADTLLCAIFAEARRGARDLYSLVKAANSARMRAAAAA